MKGVLISEMAMQLSSSVSSTVASGASGGGSSSATEIERLQRQFKNLQKTIADLPNRGLPPNQAREQAHLLTQQVLIVQAQIERLKTQKGLEQAQTQLESRHNASERGSGPGNTDAAAKAHTTDKVTGASTVSDARLQGRQATQAQSAHPASAEAITPAEPPLVSVRA
ncbi:FlxA-like family protein [Ralstonia soli]|uniref:FlxA-like family protein n=1 Tax=Ralstonia soli TaxID=2953896 RepID=A0ABT1AME0_9RALS|nr:FlxA-like family protein [Ralstonia soli]MCO5399384.1 FlxA-like family protein [Ralstonia soli]